ncbi:MAG: phosphatidylinositol 3 and 4-kinase-domain-containing protein [Monoraphidium minutum]|nr:MAG: phosphatidylinositol 3 and 4-kinase-domain-containing protein [Monoraphidium minutum]
MALSTRVADVPGHVVSAAPRPHALPVAHAVLAHAAPREAARLVRACVAVAQQAHDADLQQQQQQQYETLELMPEEPITGLKLRMLNRGFNRPLGTGSSCLVFGELDERVRAGLVSASGAAAGAAGSDWLHIFAPAASVESVSVRTLMREVCLSNADAEAAPAADAAAMLGALPLVARAAAAGGASAPAAAALGAAAAAAVVHLLVHKSARVAWRHMGGPSDAFELSVTTPGDNTKDLMRKIEDVTGLSVRDGQHQLVYGSQVLDAGRPLASYGIRKGAVLKLVPVEPPGADGAAAGADSPPRDTLPDGSPRLASPMHQLHGHWQAARAGLQEGHAPRLAAAGTGGCYFLHDGEGKPVGVFKPEDEEPLAANNPKGRAAPPAGAWGAAALGGDAAIVGGAASAAAAPGEGLRRGLRPGEGAVREVAAFVLDHGGFAGVPATAMVQLEVGGGPGEPGALKVGSLQQYVVAESDCEERGVSGFPAAEVHKIAVLDLRLGNTDRNGGNILARRGAGGAWELVPIDHGCCLPDKFEDLSFEWQWWPQAELPFDDATKAYIASLDADRDAATLAAHGLALRPECLRVLRVCTLLLQKAASAGLTAAQIAGVASRQALTKSPLEKMHSAAAALAGGGAGGALDEGAYLMHMGQLIDELLEDDFVLDNGGQLLL